MPLFPETHAPIRQRRPRKPMVSVDKRQLETVDQHIEAQSAIDFASMKRQSDEILNEAYRQAAMAPDDKTNDAILNAATIAVSKIKPRTENIQVQNAFSVHMEGTLAGWGERFAQQRTAIKRKQYHDEGMLNYESAMERGDEVAAATALEHLSVLEPENRVINDKLVEDIPVNRAMLRVRKAVANNDIQGAREAMDHARTLPLTVDQEEDLAQVEAAIGREEKSQIVQTQVELLAEADKAALVPLYETASEARATINWLNGIAEGKTFEVDPLAEIEANDIIRGLNADSTTQETEDAREKLVALLPRLGLKTAAYVKELGTRLDGEKTKAIGYAIDDAIARNLIDKSYESTMRRDLEKWINTQSGTVTPADIIAHGAELSAMVPAYGQAYPKAPGSVRIIEAVLETGGYMTSFGEWETFDGMSGNGTPEEIGYLAYSYMVQKLGLQWRTDLPAEDVRTIEDIFARKYPGFTLPGSTPLAEVLPEEPTPQKEPDIVINPKTGEKLIFKDGKWQPLEQ